MIIALPTLLSLTSATSKTSTMRALGSNSSSSLKTWSYFGAMPVGIDEVTKYKLSFAKNFLPPNSNLTSLLRTSFLSLWGGSKGSPNPESVKICWSDGSSGSLSLLLLLVFLLLLPPPTTSGWR